MQTGVFSCAQYVEREWVCVCVRWQVLCYFFSIQTKLESQLHPMPLHCFTAYTLSHAGEYRPFPLPQHDIVCTCMYLYVCKWRLLSMWQMGSHSSSSHGGGRKSLLDATTFTPPKNFLDEGNSCLTGQTQDLRKCIGRMRPGVRTPNCAK